MKIQSAIATLVLGAVLVSPVFAQNSQQTKMAYCNKQAGDKKKAYELVCVLPWNAIFVRGEYFPLFEISDNRPKSLRADLTAVTYFFSGYDGAILLAGAQRLPWHGLEFREADLQILPRMLRRYPLDYSWAQQRLFWLFKQFTGLRTHTRRLFRLFWRLAGLRKRARNIRDGRS